MTGTVQPGTRLRVLVVARPDELADNPYNAFAVRYRTLLAALSSFARVTVVLICHSASQRSPHDDLLVTGIEHVIELRMTPRSTSRSARVRTMLSSLVGASDDWDHEIEAAVRRARPDCAVSFAPWYDSELRMLFRIVPTIHFYEEDLRRMPENAPQSASAQLFRRIEDATHARSRSHPAAVVSISDGEMSAAKRRYPRSRHLCLPLTLARDTWPLTDAPSDGTSVIVAGNFTEQRNAEGLRTFLEEIARRPPSDRPPIRIISGAGLHDDLASLLSVEWVTHMVDPPSMWAEYRNASVALVPALRVTGMKATVLQAWTCGCPVVCTEAVGRTIPDRTAVLVGRTAAELVDHVLQLTDHPEDRRRLAMSGIRAVARYHDPAENERALRELCLEFVD